jgi:hypothetical protein
MVITVWNHDKVHHDVNETVFNIWGLLYYQRTWQMFASSMPCWMRSIEPDLERDRR